MKRLIVGLVLLTLFASPSAAETSFWLRNTDPDQLLVWWAVPEPVSRGQALGAVSTAPGGPHRVAPGERVRVVLPDRLAFLVTFLPWSESPPPTTAIVGGWILASELPASGTVLLDASWLGANAGRVLKATVQEWGLESPRFVLDGQGQDWQSIPALVEWGPSFTPAVPRYPKGLGRPQRLQLIDRDGALWLSLEISAPLLSGTEASLVLELGAITLEWPFTGRRAEVWSWSQGLEPQAVGSRVVNETRMEAWVPWDRLTAGARKTWSRQTGRWSWVVSDAASTTSYPLAPFTPGDLP